MSPDDTHLLIVDDNPTDIQLLTQLLEPQGYVLSFAEQGQAALTHLRSEPCDLVLIENLIPGLSGIEVCRQIQADPALAEVPVIFVTASHESETLIQAFAAGAVDYLTKPLIAQEILARLQIHLRLRSSERRLHKLMAMRELMMSTLSHDLRGPIGTMASMLDLILNSDMPAVRKQQMLENLSSSARRSYDLLEDLLTWSRAMGDELPFHPQTLPLRALAQECLEQLKAQADNKGVNLVSEVPPEMSLEADVHLLRTIMLNLLSNALKFTPAGGQVLLRGKASAELAVIEVLDEGLGIPDNLGEQLARNHTIVSRPGTAGEKGTGMGLKICQEFAARHGGWLTISRREHGSRFALELPQSADKFASKD